jgi:hypothetical protein
MRTPTLVDRIYWEVRRRWRLFRHLGGNFNAPEDSRRGRELTAGWETAWPQAQPQGQRLRCQFPQQWVRFHSLPGGKRYATSPDEQREVLRRHTAVLDWLSDGSREGDLLVIAEDWGPEDMAGGWSRRELPDTWPWRVFTSHDDDDEDQRPHNTYFWVKSISSTHEVQHLLDLAADYRADFIVCDIGSRWIFAPYDGGADVFLPDEATRDTLEALHPDWLPDRSDGL